jgi:hypothetical protein
MKTKSVLLLAILLAAASAYADCTQANPGGCYIWPAGKQINLGPMPLDSYWNPNYGILSNTNCTYGSIIRDCITAHLTRFRNQGATGVRFFFGLGGGGYSTAFNTNGTVRQAWLNNLDQFFVDLINLGYGKVTPTAVLGFWSGDSASFYTDVPVSTCGGTKTLRLMRWLPYGLTTTNYWPDCQDDNNGYYEFLGMVAVPEPRRRHPPEGATTRAYGGRFRHGERNPFA